MKHPLLTFILLLTLGASAQQAPKYPIIKYYDWQWKDTTIDQARFYSMTEPTDTGWHRQDFFINTRSLQMDGYYEDSTEKIRTGKFIYGYPNKAIESTGRYLHGKKQGLWLTFYPDRMLADSTVFEAGHAIGISKAWYQNGFPKDSASYNPDGSGIHIGWFDNGNPSFAGRLSASGKMTGRWKFFHKTGQISAIEAYDDGKFVDKQYFDEQGQPMDTTNNDRKASFKNGDKDWLNYMNGHLSWPEAYKLTNTNAVAVVISFAIDEDGKVENPYVSTPFAAPFESVALGVIRRSPAWKPAMEHNRRVKYYNKQPVVFKQPD